MSEAWVINASPLILFARIDRLDLFERLTTNIIVPLGSLGVVLRAKQHGLLETARPWVTKLVAAGMFVNGQLLTEALASIQESLCPSRGG